VSRVDEVLEAIDAAREELAELALTLGNTYGPVGAERATAEVVDGWWRGQGIRSRLVEIVDARANVVAEIGGAGHDASGRSLIFNAHLDTEASGPDYDRLMAVADPNVTGAWREGDRLFGHTVLNDRGCMAVFMIAGRALSRHAGPLPGRVVFTSVAGETGQAPVDEYQGLRYEGKGFGTSYLVEHGVVGDYALVAETTDFASCWYNCGAAYYKVTLRGSNMYTPRLVRPASEVIREHPNAIVKAAAAVQAIERWAIDREQTLAQQTPCGQVRPKAQVGAIRGGIPWRPNRSSPYCALYVDVRLLPGEPVEPATASLRAALVAAGLDAEVDVIMAKAGAVGVGVEPLADAVAAAYRRVRGEDQPREAEVAVVSMWRDNNVFNKAGIPSLTFGPSRGTADVQGRGHFELDDLVAAAKMYALTALQIAGGERLG
jgi:acetylornithine deacetylase/succinyl-diaminopimelate desuccinylase-like protein